jgi:hypothetical protein
MGLSYRAAGLSPRSEAFLGSLDGTGEAQVLTPFGPTDTFRMDWGVRQGEVLSPLRFLLWLNPWLRHVERTFPHLSFKMVGGTQVMDLAYADDIALVTSSHEDMQTLMDSLCLFLRFHGVTLSADEDPLASKTVYVASGKRRPLRVSAFNRGSKPGLSPSKGNQDPLPAPLFPLCVLGGGSQPRPPLALHQKKIL